MVISVILLIGLLFWLDVLIPVLIGIAIVAPLVVGWQILFDQVQPQGKLAWLLTVFFIPFIDVLAWVMFGRTPRRHRRFKRTSSEIRMLRQAIDSEKIETSPDIVSSYPLTRTLEKLGASGADGHTSTKLLVNGEEKFDALLDAINSATDHIHIQYYLFRTDDISVNYSPLICFTN